MKWREELSTEQIGTLTTPSSTTIAKYLKEDLGLVFKKVNVRYAQRWTKADVIWKLKYVWIYYRLCQQNWKVVYIDEFNVSDTSIKLYSWTKKGYQNYWFGPKRFQKVNCIISLSEEGPINITTTSANINAKNFLKFLEETIDKLRRHTENKDTKHMIIMDNASIHNARIVQKKMKDLWQLVIALPPYTPEWNAAELAINVVKSQIDGDI